MVGGRRQDLLAQFQFSLGKGERIRQECKMKSNNKSAAWKVFCFLANNFIKRPQTKDVSLD